jgi:hypothetical protein
VGRAKQDGSFKNFGVQSMEKNRRSAENVCNFGKSVKFVHMSHYSISAFAWKTSITTDSGRMDVHVVNTDKNFQMMRRRCTLAYPRLCAEMGIQSVVLFKKDKTMLVQNLCPFKKDKMKKL